MQTAHICVLISQRFALLLLFVFLYPLNSQAFSCRTANQSGITGGSKNIYVNLQPSIGVGQNLVVDLSKEIFCKNDVKEINQEDVINLKSGSLFGGSLKSFAGSVYFNGATYPFPLSGDTSALIYSNHDNVYKPWPVRLYLTPMGGAGGVVINNGSLIATLSMYKFNKFYGDAAHFTWNIYANHSVVVPVGGCDVSSRNITVTLPDYPGTAAVPLSVHCAQSQQLAYYLTGTTADASGSVFANTAASPAAGIGVQLSGASGVITANQNISLGQVGPSPVNLGLKASYARIAGHVSAGNVQSVIGVTFVYL
ncbi:MULTISPECIES: fimbrial protein [Dickeya]|uniref:Mannose-specific adhesin FimH n=1 Tax=Dickeya aquatica TaxID=1401087 RepID=A0A375A8L6_9GAMM|nr:MULTISPECIES: fimbrial protein [Dickeya]SLM61979.1 mannose-specific adhesin FimH [Dickeya aquatica]